jgi:acylphosphatase
VSTVRFLVRGLVQGVGFRWFVARHARGLGLSGYARNLPDGSVEVLARGGDSTVLARFEELLAKGPDYARVEGVSRQDEPDDLVTTRSFDIR